MTPIEQVGDGIRIRPYDSNGNRINTALVSLPEGGLLVLGPGTDLGPDDFEAVDQLGQVRAIVSPGAYHNMGMPAWHARYPEAGLYAPKAAIAHIGKLHKELPPLSDLDALAALLPEGVTVEEAEGMGQPDVHLVTRRDDGVTWFTNEALCNAAAWPKSFPVRMAFKLFRVTPGLNVNTLALMLVRGDKKAIRRYFEAKLEAAPPTRLVPSHGVVDDGPDLAERLREVLGRRL
ncbi:MAG: hypothetical protein H6739_36035 [Alphaproteobacteria bacterium]|nr:hypothetical protein [Alphaproteobacteria bacterium]